MTTKILEVLHAGAAALALVLATACAASSPNTSGETHFVTCHTPSDCLAKLGPDYTCVDQVCKRTLDGSMGSGGAGGTGGSSGATSGGASSGSGGAASSRLCKTINDDSGDTDASTVASILGDAAASCDIEPSSYDQSCTVDKDCTPVGFGNLCEVPCGVQCANSAINVGALTQYNADYAKNPAAVCGPFFCGCPAEGEPVCRGGKCELGSAFGSNDGGPTAHVDSGPGCATCGGSSCCAGTCTDDRCLTTLVTSIDTPVGIAVRDGYVFWGSEGDCNVQKVSAATGAITLLSKCNIGPLTSIAVDDTYVYDLEFGILRRTPITGGSPEGIAGDSSLSASGLVLDASRAYWSDYHDGVLVSAALHETDAGSRTRIIAYNVDNAFPDQLAVGNGHLYYADGTTVVSQPLDAGSPIDAGSLGLLPPGTKIIASNMPIVGNVVVDGTTLFWTTALTATSNGTLWKARVDEVGDAAAPGQLFASSDAFHDFIIDGNNAYASTGDSVIKSSLQGGDTITIVSGLTAVDGLAVDDASLYLMESGTNTRAGSILKLSPK